MFSSVFAEFDFSRLSGSMGLVGADGRNRSKSLISSADQLPAVVSDSSVFDIPALCEKLGYPFEPEPSDAELILAAYRKWGEDCPLYLEGEFSFVIWDPAKHCLFAARDHVAARPFFYYSDSDRVVFASDPESILASPGVRRSPNLEKIALLGLPRGSTQLPEDSFHFRIQTILGGTSMAVTRAGIRRRRYWRPEVNPSLIPPNEDEAFEALRSLIVKSVEARIGNRRSVGALLSGGLDSSSLVAIASRYLDRRNGTVTALSHVMPEGDPNGFRDERPFIAEFNSWKNIDINYITPPPEAGPFDNLLRPELFRRTFYKGAHRYIFEAIHKQAAARGVDLILDGVGGEYGPTAHNRVYFLELAVSGKWFTLRRELRQLRLREGISPVRELAGHIRNLLIPNRRRLPTLLLNPRFVAEHHRKIEPLRPWPNQARLMIGGLRELLDVRAALPPSVPIRYAYPLLDRHVLEFSLAAPSSMKVKDGYYRLLIRRAMEGILPPAIQWRIGKGLFCPDYIVRYNRQVDRARNWLAVIGPKDPVCEIVDIPSLRRNLVHHELSASEFPVRVQVPCTMYLINFLRQFAEFQA